MEKMFQTITPQGFITERALYTEAEARIIASDGETLCECYPGQKIPYLVGEQFMNRWVKCENIGGGVICFNA